MLPTWEYQTQKCDLLCQQAGTPLGAVQQLADREAGASAAQIAALARGDGNSNSNSNNNKDAAGGDSAPAQRMAKFMRMKRAGVPPMAIRNAARLQGYDVGEVNEALGLQEQADEERKGLLEARTEEERAADTGFLVGF